MVARIVRHRRHITMKIQHMGLVIRGIVDTGHRHPERFIHMRYKVRIIDTYGRFIRVLSRKHPAVGIVDARLRLGLADTTANHFSVGVRFTPL